MLIRISKSTRTNDEDPYRLYPQCNHQLTKEILREYKQGNGVGLCLSIPLAVM